MLSNAFIRRWVAALFASIVGVLVLLETITISTEALAILILMFAFVLWYDFFENVIVLRNERRRAEEWHTLQLANREKFLNEEVPSDVTIASESWDGK